jgi:hypothetical protein
MNSFGKVVRHNRLNYEFLKAVNGVLGFTEREIRVATKFLELNSRHTELVKKLIRKEILSEGLVNASALTFIVKKFYKVGFLVSGPRNGVMKINPSLVPNVIDSQVQIYTVLKIKDNESK